MFVLTIRHNSKNLREGASIVFIHKFNHPNVIFISLMFLDSFFNYIFPVYKISFSHSVRVGPLIKKFSVFLQLRMSWFCFHS